MKKYSADVHKADIHSIETCGTVDGPGLRYVAFFQGCPLRCKYCHNPDTWEINAGKKMTVSELVADVVKYKSYMRFSAGGFTASGGEPLLQAEFIAELFKILKLNGIHTTLDTSGAVFSTSSGSRLQKKIETLLDYTDLVLLDIKSICPDKYRKLTGVKLNPTLDFLEALKKKRISTWIRYVIVPGLTDSSDEAKALADYLEGFSNIERVELLPFHKLGEYKWEAMEKTYTLKDTPAPSDETMEELRSFFKNKA